MYSMKMLYSEVREKYETLSRGSRVSVEKSAVVAAFMREHDGIFGEDRDLAIFLMNRSVCESVTRFFREVHGQEQDPDEWVKRLPGFEHVQSVYSIERAGDQVLVPTSLMTVEEKRAKAVELRSMASGLTAHADELDRLADEEEAAKA